MDSAVKLCKDCRHYAEATQRGFDRCGHPAVAQPDYVRGDIPTQYCEIVRLSGICGRDGKLWQAKQEQRAA